jgi:hypothetical protein
MLRIPLPDNPPLCATAVEVSGTYSQQKPTAARLKALTDDSETQTPEPHLCYQLAATRQVLLEDDLGQTQEVSMGLIYFVNAGQPEYLDFTRSLLLMHYPHLAAGVAALRAAEVVASDQLVRVWLEDEQAWFFVNKVDSWEEDQASTVVEFVRLL